MADYDIFKYINIIQPVTFAQWNALSECEFGIYKKMCSLSV